MSTTSTGDDEPLSVATPRRDSLIEEVEQRGVFEALFGEPAPTPMLGRYVVLRTLGRGGMGTVLEAFDRTLDRKVAIKILHREFDERHTSRLIREAQAMAKLSHPNVVPVFEAGQVDGKTFVVMELVEGETLGDWVRSAPRPGWRECVEVFIQAGEGLAAAHEQGLIHRDFKPGNAIVDRKGRARVLDFGLVRRTSEEEPSIGEPAWNSELIGAAEEPDHSRLTLTGTVLGTPAYMPPEQMRGMEADARSDQFSFCVALYEAIYGERPFEGSSVAALMVAMTGGSVRPAPKGSDAPSSLRAVLVRGLAIEPAQRWPSMDALLAELRARVVPRARRGIALGLTVGLVTVGGGLAAGRYAEVMERCTGASAHLRGVWDDARRDAVEQAILGTGRVFAPDTWAVVEAELNRRAQDWVRKHTEICEATRVTAEQTEEAMDLRMGCLRSHRRDLDAAVGVLIRVDERAVTKAIELVTELPELERCDDVDRLVQQRQRVPPPDDPQVAQEVATLREQLATITAMRRIGQYTAALEEIDPLIDRAEALGYMPLVAEAKVRRGDLRDEDGRYADAEEDLQGAYALAVEHEHDPVALEAAQALTYVVGYSRSRHEEGLVWGRTAAIPLAKRSGTALDVAISEGAMASVLRRQGQYELAKLYLERALRVQEQVLGEEHLRVATLLNSLGNVLNDLGDHAQASLHLERALQIRERVLGPQHPVVGYTVNGLGITAFGRGEYEDAERLLRRALRIWEQALGEDHPNVATTASNLSNVLDILGEYDQARLQLERALRIQERTRDADDPALAVTHNNLGNVFESLGDYEQAKEHLQHAVRLLELASEPDRPGHPDLARSLTNLGGLLYRLEDYEPAELHLERALRIWGETPGDGHPDQARAMIVLAKIGQARGDLEAFRRHADRASSILEANDVAPPLVAEARFVLAQALWADASERTRALELARQARVGWRDQGPGSENDLADVEAWLGARAEPDPSPSTPR